MEKSEDYIQQVRSLMSNYVTGSMQVLHEAGSLVKKTAVTATKEGVQNTLDPAKLITNWLDFNLKVTSILSEHTLATFKEIVHVAECTMASPSVSSDKAEGGSEKELSLRVEGQQKECVSTPFLVHNQYNKDLTITFTATDIVSANGKTLPSSHITFSPAGAALKPGEQLVVHANVQITDDFEVNQTYLTKIKLLGFNAKDISLTILVLPAKN